MLSSLLLLLQTAVVVPPATAAPDLDGPRGVSFRYSPPRAPHVSPVSDHRCRGVAGLIEARAAHVGLDWHGFRARGDGTISGDLDGAVRLEVRRRSREGEVTGLAIRVDVFTSEGTYRLDGPATAWPAGTVVEGHSVEGSFEVARTRSPEPAGELVVDGTADLRSRTIRVRYAGRICGGTVDGVDAEARGDIR